tara:strand:+ start:2117 stop:2641 length:525 start_codon:yes stop_codon:yes gene_type:complete
MIIVEDILKEIFSQLPAIKDSNSVDFSPHFNWGSQNTLNLYLSQLKKSVKYPLIWLTETVDDSDIYAHKLEKPVKLILAKQSNHTTNTNPIIWETEFKNILNPLLKNVITSIEKSGVTSIKDGRYKSTRLANYSENEGADSKTIDNWNVIVFEATVIFREKADGTPNCIKTIKF